mmetsp:Transcript_16305/g.35260  ORF Transcript_16305/g.35260 Transcript_16305/m.35260 type:complete len:88 (+) Transcript_16305:76-339(+)|eukprot:CAMPEP_0202902098 /NCGR_PEP_ID=MMETSP1392-20130828/16369_1 /ASSEMBLY_ACC=CAM_ASM_000868 /TAXON_ID=225041 /ORGANISM="Chlamydomonas chlamydogama, Strain SAG 11-48b" /LENGTH=87 /DNA_ID=CAMNT_0049588801 /DNA_START=76 /DNA_END=339 /DNA_ORIENTATION=-
MSYSAYFRTANFQFPSGIVGLVAAWSYVTYFAFDRPAFGFKEVSGAEYKASPVQYLQNEEHHRVRFPKVPGQSSVSDTHPPHSHGHH